MSKWEAVYELMRRVVEIALICAILIYAYFRVFDEESFRHYIDSFIDRYPGPTILIAAIVAYLALKSALEKERYYDYIVALISIAASVFILFDWLAS